MVKILFVCTGNTCRSSMAEALFKDMLKKQGRNDVLVKSSGIYALEGNPASKEAIQVLREEGIDLTYHKANLLTKQILNEVDIILTMTKQHKYIILTSIPSLKNKVFTLKEYAYGKQEDISDPFGKGNYKYIEVKQEIKEALKKIIEKI